MTKQIKDDAGAIVNLLGYSTANSIAFTASTAVSAPISAKCKIVSITTTSPAFVTFGDANAVAVANSSHYIVANSPYDVVVYEEGLHSDYISVLGATTTGTLYLSERK